MISSISVKNFQSLYDVEIPLSPFTVIVGKSSSGKSAFIRAVRLLLQNQRGSSFISHGQDQTSVQAGFDSGASVSIYRGKRNEYCLYADPTGAHVDVFTKLNGEVPDEVEKFFGIDPALSIAAQFDPPYLLTASGGEVARTLGALTNVDVVLSAGREASRRRLSAGTTLKVLQGQIEEDRAAHALLDDAPDRMAAVEKAERALERVEQYEEDLMAVGSVQGAIIGFRENLRAIPIIEVPETEELFRAAEQAIADEQAIERVLLGVDYSLDRVKQVQAEHYEIPVVDFEEAERLNHETAEAEALVDQFRNAMEEFKQATWDLQDREETAVLVAGEYANALREAKICPTCGQGTEHLHA